MTFILLLSCIGSAQSSVTCDALNSYENVLTSRTVRMIKIEIDNVAHWLSQQDFSSEKELGSAISDYWNERFAPLIGRIGEAIPDRVTESFSEIVEYNRPALRRERWGRALLNQCTAVQVAGNESFVLTQLFRNREIKRDVCDCFRSRMSGIVSPWVDQRMFR